MWTSVARWMHAFRRAGTEVGSHRSSADERIRQFRERRRLAVAYDCADWHLDSEFPEELPASAAATHIGLFLGWALRRGLASQFHRCEHAGALHAVCRGQWSGSRFLLEACDGIFWEQDLDEVGNRFTISYYLAEVGYGLYLDDYEEFLSGTLPSLYHVPDSPRARDMLEPRIERRFDEWRRTCG